MLFLSLPETLPDVEAGYKSSLEEGPYTWCHNSALQIIANYFTASPGASLYTDLPCFHSPSIIKADNFLPDLVLVSPDNKI